MPTRAAEAAAEPRAVASAGKPAAVSRVRSCGRREAPPVAGSGGGQSAAGLPELLPPRPVGTRVLAPARSSPAQVVGLCESGQGGKSAVCRTGRRRTSLSGAERDGTGDMAHLAVPVKCFAFSSLSQRLFSLLVRLRCFGDSLESQNDVGLSSPSPCRLPPGSLDRPRVCANICLGLRSSRCCPFPQLPWKRCGITLDGLLILQSTAESRLPPTGLSCRAVMLLKTEVPTCNFVFLCSRNPFFP
jgi:hypothetical protein